MDKIAKGNNKRWLYIPLGILIFMCLGTVYSWTVFRKSVEESFKVGATESGLPYMFFLFFYAISMPIAGRFINKDKIKMISIIGGLVVALGWFLSGFVHDIKLLSITYGLIAGSGVGIIYGVPIAVAAEWFPDKKGLAVGLTLVGFGLSPFITAPLAQRLLETYGLLQTFRILGIGFAIVITLLSFPLKFPSIDYKLKDDSISDHFKIPVIEIDTRKMFKNLSFYGLWICFVIGTLIGLMAIAITSPVAEEIIKMDARKAAYMVSLFAIFNGLGRPLFGWMTDKYQPKFAAITSYILIIFASVLILVSGEGNTVLYAISFALFWLNLGGWLAIAPAATGTFFGMKFYSKNYGFVFTAYGVGAILGTMLSGSLRDIMGNYLYVFYPIIILAILGIILAMFFLEKPKAN